ncbi:type II secretion system secretin GspD [Hyphobacterium marinum]|uniref:Type II secretion system secretin GspD n=1 Tax=Hyphobacterium marinum TaxID=3116574 RepID=A0ABU7LW21_9PROT|nr:type II secretion system secretin GspD [Hyphobacterium sp. Y6023]MEE2565758.1 type II secretion system secretin GspD [Hyphobacterium sp. Y6023]
MTFARFPRLLAMAGCAALLGLTGPAGVGAPVFAQNNVLNFQNADIRAFIDDVSLVTGYTFIVDPEVRGQVTITSQVPLDEAGVFEVFLATLRVNGYAAVRTRPGVYQILPDIEGPRAGGAGSDASYVTAVVRLDHASARGAVTAIRPMMSPQSVINPVEGSNVLVMVDYAANIERARSVLAGLDRDTSVFEMVEMTNVSATDMAGIIEGMRARTSSNSEDGMFGVTVVPVPSSNSILLRGERAAVDQMRDLAARVDAVSRSSQDYRVVYLSHADGASLLPILENISAEIAGESGSSGEQVSVAFHPATNALIINAPPDAQRQIEQVIRQLDIRRPQVLVEAIIVEISDSASRDLGLQFLLSGDDDGDAPFVMSRYNNARPNLLALTGALTFAENDEDSAASPSLRTAAINSLLAASGITAGFGGQDSNGNLFGVILNAVRDDQDSNILSTPSILTLDNEEASILVGQQIPITTGETLGANNTNPFRTIERQDVGVQLEVRPQISEGDTIRLFIRQEVSSIFGPVSANSTDLITNNREIQTTVLADNGEIIVLGGLIQQDQQDSVSAVPGLGRVPGIGRLFRSEGTSTVRTNLMVFIRPTIIRSAEDMRGATGRSYGQVRQSAAGAPPPGLNDLDAIARMMMPPSESPTP